MTLAPSTPSANPWRFCTAPMMDWSDRHCRYFWRLMSREARLYTEMVTTGALIFGDRQRFLAYSPAELPLALQLGGHNPQHLAQCARMAEDAGFSEVNLNCGCPSDRVQEGRIGAILMKEPEQVAECIAAMQAACSIPITLKHRLGVDNQDSDEALHRFVAINYSAGCRVFIVHARKAWLNGLSPKENREVPPLQYERVSALKAAFPEATWVLNGGIANLSQAQTLLETLDGVMLGREAYQNPYLLAQVDRDLFGASTPVPDRYSLIAALEPYIEQVLAEGLRLHSVTRHLLGLFAGEPGGRLFRRHLSEQATQKHANLDTLRQALAIQREAAAGCAPSQSLP
jgi:tRNA-dihydrouridine synthase A